MTKRWSREMGVGLLLLVTIMGVQVVNSGFLATRNILDLLIQASPFAILACGMTIVVLLGEVDISIGSLGGTLAALMGIASSASHWGLSLPATIGVVCAAGAAVGALNGALVAYAGIPSIIATLALLTILKGVTQVMLGGVWVTDLPVTLRFLGTGSIGPIPVPILVASGTILVTATFLGATPFGRRVYAIGSNADAAHVRGLPIKPVKCGAFCLMGLLTAIAVLISAPQLSVIESGFGTGWELFVVTCVVVGGVSIQGGRGTLLGALLGVVLLSIIRTVLVFLKLGDQATYWERSIQGAFILGATLADRVGTRSRLKEAG